MEKRRNTKDRGEIQRKDEMKLEKYRIKMREETEDKEKVIP